MGCLLNRRRHAMLVTVVYFVMSACYLLLALHGVGIL